MGYYIEVPNPTHKAEQLVRLHGAELVLLPELFDFSGDYALICVVENGLFDAAGVAYSPSERDAFNNPDDTRDKVWLKLPKSVVLKLNPLVPLE
jgi:hypothetical protein